MNSKTIANLLIVACVVAQIQPPLLSRDVAVQAPARPTADGSAVIGNW